MRHLSGSQSANPDRYADGMHHVEAGGHYGPTPILGEPMMKNFTWRVCSSVMLRLEGARGPIDSTESYPVIEAMVEVPAGNFWMGCNLMSMPSARLSGRRCVKFS